MAVTERPMTTYHYYIEGNYKAANEPRRHIRIGILYRSRRSGSAVLLLPTAKSEHIAAEMNVPLGIATSRLDI